MVGRTVSHYEIAAKIGEGGMGAVYRARDVLLGRTVAIKVMLGDALEADSEERLRFLQEARAASILNHPGIVTVYDILREVDGDFIVMELVDGENLAARMNREPLSTSEILELGIQITDAVGAAHAAGIIHRDLKPGNIMITRQGRVKILDFGLAKLAHPLGELDDHSPTAPQTAAGRVFGTLDYMSPEQLLGRPVDARSDVFSLGTILYEAVAGRRPFSANSAAEAIHSIVYEPHPSLGSAQPDAPASLARLIDRALAKNPEERFADAVEMSRALVDVREGRAEVTAQLATASPSAERSAPTRSKRWPRLVVVGALIAGFALIGAWALSRGMRSPELPEPTSQEALLPAGVPLPSTPQSHNARGAELMRTYWRKGHVDQAVEQYQRAIELDPKNAPAHAGLSRAYLRKYKDTDDQAWLKLSLQTARQAVELEPQLSSAQVALGFAEAAGGQDAQAGKRFEETLLLDPSNADAVRGRAELALRAGNNKEAESGYRQAVALRPDDQELHGHLAVFFYRGQRLDEAAAEFRRMIELAPDNVAAYRNLAAVLHLQGNYTAAAKELQRSLEYDPDPAVYSNLGTLYFFQGLYPQSVASFEKALELGANDYQIWANLGDAYRWTPGNDEKAKEAFTRALQLLDEKLRTMPEDRGLLSQQAVFLAKAGDPAQGRTRASKLFAKGERDPQNLYRLTLAFELAGDREQALAAIGEAVSRGFSTEELKNDPELSRLRSDVRYHRRMLALQQRQAAESP